MTVTVLKGWAAFWIKTYDRQRWLGADAAKASTAATMLLAEATVGLHNKAKMNELKSKVTAV